MTPVPRGADLRVADVVREHAARRPGAVAVKQGARELTYAMLDERSNRLAQALLASGAGPGSRIAHLDRSAPEIVELLLATSKIGAVTVPLNWRLAVPELRAVLEDARALLVVAGPATRRPSPSWSPRSPRRHASCASRRTTSRGSRPRRRSTRAGEGNPATSCCSSTPRARPACRRASSPRTGTWPRPRRRRRTGSSTPTRSL